MSTPAETTTAPEPGSAPLDEVMLAMDVVDTLRHERQLVAQELDADKRRRRLVERVKAIYESQGIEVSDAVVREGVKALEEDRFTYDPPPRTFAVRLAEVYVDRRKWALRTAIAGALVIAVWLAFTVPARLQRQGMVDGFRERVTAMASQVDGLAQQRSDLQRDLANTDAASSTVVTQILADAGEKLAATVTRIDALKKALRPGPDADAYPDDTAKGDAFLKKQRSAIRWVTTELGSVAGHLQVVSEHQNARRELDRLGKRIAAMTISAETKAQVDELTASIGAALDARDGETARRELLQLRSLVTKLEQSYELRIVSGPGKQSGVWRYPNARRDTRNYYVIVEAISPKGKRLRLSITNEENQSTSRVKTFGIRVTKEFYDKVKADKLDNGIIDNRVVGSKKRGARALEYTVPVAGGMITRW